ncbi:predicted protein [Sclerotinia sclerotiorum 1980 UF-70]|uniref:Uncharacterized protein n=1 Tax=Sclerotinia sclerotiorum (strain ATCC 18683 / 1980 / Ss-1) TaxID=665079 RepID=A7E663_SCLS1|nr:predicted protein [Sclerotinia sclerotiorum 1980 UF-70]EDN91385.1 predicted protein [Sclerotinia sclerotiorum 1980 UF-70]
MTRDQGERETIGNSWKEKAKDLQGSINLSAHLLISPRLRSHTEASNNSSFLRLEEDSTIVEEKLLHG